MAGGAPAMPGSEDGRGDVGAGRGDTRGDGGGGGGGWTGGGGRCGARIRGGIGVQLAAGAGPTAPV